MAVATDTVRAAAAQSFRAAFMRGKNVVICDYLQLYAIQNRLRIRPKISDRLKLPKCRGGSAVVEYFRGRTRDFAICSAVTYSGTSRSQELLLENANGPSQHHDEDEETHDDERPFGFH